MIYSFRMTVSIQGNNYDTALKKFMALVAKRFNKGFQKSITLCNLEKKTTGGNFVSLDHVSVEKQDLINKIVSMKPHTGLTPLEEFSTEQLTHHLSKLEDKLQKEVKATVQKKLGWKRRNHDKSNVQ